MSESGSALTPVVLQGHVIDMLRTLEQDSVQCVVTSTPYWGQRVYETEPQIWGGDQTHQHVWQPTPPRRHRSKDDRGYSSAYGEDQNANCDLKGGECCKCGSWRGELGLEPTPELFVEHLCLVFDEIRRVLKEDGTCWVNLAGAYATSPSGNTTESRWKNSKINGRQPGTAKGSKFSKLAPGWKAKEYVPVPWLFGLEMHRRGWWIRADVQWWKLNGKHESAMDRPFRAHEYVTMFTKTAFPFYNEEAVRQPYVPSTIREIGVAYRSESKKVTVDGQDYSLYDRQGAQDPSDLKRQIIKSLAERGGSMLPDVWYMATGDGEGRHVAVFPEPLPELCITASSRPGDVVLDPFAGSGTTLRVARRLRRASIGIELNPDSAAYAIEKIAKPQTTRLDVFSGGG